MIGHKTFGVKVEKFIYQSFAPIHLDQNYPMLLFMVCVLAAGCQLGCAVKQKEILRSVLAPDDW